jgi:hypothetical protein
LPLSPKCSSAGTRDQSVTVNGNAGRNMASLKLSRSGAVLDGHEPSPATRPPRRQAG